MPSYFFYLQQSFVRVYFKRYLFRVIAAQAIVNSSYNLLNVLELWIVDKIEWRGKAINIMQNIYGNKKYA